jgi:hypothetical protein
LNGAAGSQSITLGSSANGGDCVETASGNGVVLVRDTVDPDGAVLGFSAQAWAAFTASLR